MDRHVPASIQPLLQDYLARLQTKAPDLLFGLYVHGSIAYGAFCEQASDIDLLAVTNRGCNPEDLVHLERIHAELRAAWPQWKLEVSYVPKADCEHWQSGIAPAHPFHRDGEFVDAGVFDFNSPLWAANLWWMIKTRGITLLGPEPDTLGINVLPGDIVATSRQLIESYWPEWTNPRQQLFKLRHELHVNWVVFGTLRGYYTLREQELTTKPGAAEYGLAHLPKRWHRLIRDTLANRTNPAKRGLVSRIRTGVVTALYLRFIIRECRQVASASQQSS